MNWASRKTLIVKGTDSLWRIFTAFLSFGSLAFRKNGVLSVLRPGRRRAGQCFSGKGSPSTNLLVCLPSGGS